MVTFQEIGRLPAPNDNCAIAIRTLAAGTIVTTGITRFTISHTILEGHRFAVRPIPAGDLLLSWGEPFGRALKDIALGEYVCNTGTLQELGSRRLDFTLPQEPNFEDALASFHFDAGNFQPAAALPKSEDARRFMGFERAGERGVGTRNDILLLGVNALVGGFVGQLQKALKPLAAQSENVDDIAAVAHTEGSQRGSNNQEMLLRTLAGYMVHPNVGAVLVLDAGDVGVSNEMLEAYALANNYPLDAVPHAYVSLTRPFAADLAYCTAVVESWLPQVNGMRRSPQPLSALKIALQCGGSDAFSGISGNPLAALVSKEIVQAGGSAVLAETDELIGAEAYVLQKVADVQTAERFLEMVAAFQERVGRHGHSAQGNPSGGNKYRGLYNIYLKSLGAATKRHPDTRLDGVLEYGQRMEAPGYYFMDSPGNDLESIAGQVATGCNLIYFVTGNGSITNFPFVPTIKIVTTSARYALLPEEMDVNAGAYLDGVPLPELAQNMLDLTLDVAGGRRTVGEKAGHAQVQIWRNWQLNGRINLEQIASQPRPTGQPLPLPAPAHLVGTEFETWETEIGPAADRVGLILPASLCSAQIAQIAAQRLNERGIGQDKQLSHFVALAHTEGCGGSTQAEFVDTMIGYLTHPAVATCLLLEHGCEKTHNDFWRGQMLAAGINPERFGWSSVQLDGGIERTLANIEDWFRADLARMPVPHRVRAGLASLRLGIMSGGSVDQETAAALAQLAQQIAACGGSVVLPANDSLLQVAAFSGSLGLGRDPAPTTAYAQPIRCAGFHLMANPTVQWAETMTGLGAAGVSLILAAVGENRRQGHPFIPVVQMMGETADYPFDADSDLVLTGSPGQRLEQLLGEITAVFDQANHFAQRQEENIGFQITRGQLGVSL